MIILPISPILPLNLDNKHIQFYNNKSSNIKFPSNNTKIGPIDMTMKF